MIYISGIVELDEDDKDTYLELMDDDTKDEMEELSEYDDDEVGSIMDTDFIEISADIDVKEAMKVLVNEAPDVATINTLFVVDNDKFVGTLDFRRLMMGIVFYYFGAVYLLQGIFHWFFPIPGLLEDVRKEQEAVEKARLEAETQKEEPIENSAEETKEENKPE